MSSNKMKQKHDRINAALRYAKKHALLQGVGPSALLDVRAMLVKAGAGTDLLRLQEQPLAVGWLANLCFRVDPLTDDLAEVTVPPVDCDYELMWVRVVGSEGEGTGTTFKGVLVRDPLVMNEGQLFRGSPVVFQPRHVFQAREDVGKGVITGCPEEILIPCLYGAWMAKMAR